MTLRELLAAAGIPNGDDSPVLGLTADPARTGPGIVFVAIDTPLARGHARVRQAIKRGASALVVESLARVPANPPCPVFVVADSKRTLAMLAAALFGHAHRELRLWAVTGTKGKSTVCHLLAEILKASGTAPGLLATKVQRIGSTERASEYTTPEAPELHEALRGMVDAGAVDVIVEASSIGIAFDRMHGLALAGAVFTNLGRDHLTTHGGLDALKAAKARLFTDFDAPLCVVNVDDPWGETLAQIAAGRVVTYGLAKGELQFENLAFGPGGITGTIAGMRIASPLLGRHNASNVLAAAALGVAAGWPAGAIVDGIGCLAGVAGRLERITGDIAAYVDYAHTPESVDAVLETLRQIHGDRRLVAVLGCSGGTDPTKRPEMARAAVARADHCIFTADNPRLEDPNEIAKQMVAGLAGQETWEIEIDRRAAIERGVELARPDGVLAVLGKGDETSQEIGWESHAFDDRVVLAAALAR
ncbi:MAG TPA: UDP-N-acetylmuramoyl-L-alanyl-D-glutamate--2,6-diaminopimelate ligase [Kofleriaceae bacterium]